MLLLLLVASIPVVGIAGANAVLSYEAELDTGRRNAAFLAEVAAARHGATILAMREILQGLARDPRVLSGDEATCNAALATALAIHRSRYADFLVTDAAGRLRCSGLPAVSGASLTDRSYVRDALAGSSFSLAEFRTGLRSGQPVLTGAVPVTDGTGLRGVVAAGLLLDFLVRDEARTGPAAPQRIWLVDRDEAALPLTAAAQGELPAAGILRQLEARPGTTALEAHSAAGAEFAYAHAQLGQGLRLLVGLPTAPIRTAANKVLLRRVVELAAFLLACLLVIVLGADIAIARPLRALARRVRIWRPGAPFGGHPLRGEPDEVRGLEQAFTDAALAIAAREEELRAALRQRDLLMAEIHHRVKNNLQIVASLLNLQAGRLRDPAARAEFSTARDRVQALATLHRHLYTNRTFEVIALRPFLEELGQQLFSALGERPGQRIKLVVEADELEIVTDQAVSLALLVTETVTNAIKHAFPGSRSGTITIRVRAQGEEVTLTVRDDGLGMRLRDDENGHGIGLTLIRGFAQHLGGTIEMREAEGTELLLRFTLRRREAEPMVPAGLRPDGAL
jgi:two-component sensor histidine kinase